MLILHLESKVCHWRRYWSRKEEVPGRLPARNWAAIPNVYATVALAEFMSRRSWSPYFWNSRKKQLLLTCKMVTFHKNSRGRSVGRPQPPAPEPWRGYYLRWSPYF